MLFYLLAIAALLPWIALLINGYKSAAAVPALADLPDPSAGADLSGLPLLSVVIAARNEAAQIEDALRSLMVQSHPHYEVIVINDRSTDETGPIIDRLAAEFEGR